MGIIDCDVHPAMNPITPDVLAHLPQRWRDHVAEWGAIRGGSPGGDRPRHREFASRWDAEPPEGGAPGSNPAFAREQLLDRYHISAALLNDIGGYQFSGGRNQPPELSAAYCTALNEARKQKWFEDDPRWFASMNIPYELPGEAVKEIRRQKEDPVHGHRWKQLTFAPDNTRPPGHPFYYPIYEACEEYGLPISFHVLASNRITASGAPNYYFEEHCDWAAFNWPLVSSLVFQGVFDRFPTLKVVLVELAWSWAVPLAWRMDHAYRVLGSEVPHLQRRPSEYLADHFWYTTQPMEEPENAAWFDDVLEMFGASGMRDKLMFSSDYPHWDFDEPDALSKSVSDDQARRILGENASQLYGIPLLPGKGWERP
jgi:predicted TIM-barrel fold metal-dependent hydrolase